MTFRNFIFWIFVVMTILFTGYWAFIAFHEWFIVGYTGKTAGYPWGPVNENAWYFKTPAIYSKVMLVEFILLAAGLGLAIYRVIKLNKVSILYTLLGLWFLMILMLLNASFK
jgi:hypothetical protein